MNISVQVPGQKQTSNPMQPTKTLESNAPDQATFLARATKLAPRAMPTIGRQATPKAKVMGTSKNSNLVPMPYAAKASGPKLDIKRVTTTMVATVCIELKLDIPPTLRMSMNKVRDKGLLKLSFKRLREERK